MNKVKFIRSHSVHRMIFTCLSLILSLNIFAQKINVKGNVFDVKKEPIIGASVLEQGTQNGTVTNIDGEFDLSVEKGAMLTITYVGYEPITVKAEPKLDIILKEDTENLEEVVVIGYGSVKRKDLTTSVSTVTTKDLDRRPLVSAAQAIQGRAAGVSVIQPNGAPGGEMSIRVRGTTSMNASNDPLYVVDGVPVDNIKFLSPNDIASMQILKDASSAAIYGSRAASGVILITTKQGANGDAKITFNAQYSMNKVIKSMDVLNASQYKELQDEIGAVNLPDNLTDETDWFKETFTNGSTQNYQVSISDGNDKMRYFLSGGYLNEKGVLDVSFYKRYNFRASIDGDVRKWLNVSANINYSDYSSNGVITGQGANRGGVILSVINTPTYAPIWDPNNPEQYYRGFYGVNITSPLENLSRSENNKNKENRLIASGSATFKILPELTFKSTLTLDRRNAISTEFVDPVKTEEGRKTLGYASDNRNTNTVFTFDNILTYNKSFKKHNIEVMAGSSWTESEYLNSYMSGTHFRNGDIQTVNAANKISWTGTGSGVSEWAINSYFGRFAYNYDSKYLLTANIRSDGSSKLSPENRWGIFPSVSAAWRISSEGFMSDISWINDLKLRGGWGQTGNQSGLGDYSYLQRYNIQRQPWFEANMENALPLITQANLRTKDLTWETTTQSNIGVDFTVLNSRLNIVADYYYKNTVNMLMYVALPAGSSGSGSIERNEGEMVNKGFELAISSKNITGAFEWNTDFNISFNKNKLTKLALTKIYSDAVVSDVVKDFVVRNVAGRPLGGFYGYISDGVNPETGELNYRDINEDGRISASDKTYIGDPNPDFIFGMTNTFSYKGFNLSVFLQGSYGNDIYNASRIETEGMYDGKNQSTRVLDRWRIPGQITDVPKAGFDIKNSSYFVEDGSFLRVKDVSLSYDINVKKLKKYGIGKIQPYFTASNLFTLTKYKGIDPEVNQWGNKGSVQGIDWGTYPHSRSFVVGVNLEF